MSSEAMEEADQAISEIVAGLHNAHPAGLTAIEEAHAWHAVIARLERESAQDTLPRARRHVLDEVIARAHRQLTQAEQASAAPAHGMDYATE